MNLLHSIKARPVSSTVNVVVEIPLGSKSKIEYDKDREEFVFDRNINKDLSFPFNYGLVPETWSTDNDPLDVILLSSQTYPTGSQVESRIVGILSTTDQDGPDSKLITIPISESDPTLSSIKDIDTIDREIDEKIQFFYKNYKINEPGKWVDVNGFISKKDAENTLLEAINRYHQHFPQ